MFEGMRKFEKSRKFGEMLREVNGVEDGFEWNLVVYVRTFTVYKKMAKVTFIHKYFLSFDVMKQLEEVFTGCEMRVEADGDRLVLVIMWD